MDEEILVDEIADVHQNADTGDSGDVFWQTEVSSNLLVAKGALCVCLFLLMIMLGVLADVFYLDLKRSIVILSIACVFFVPVSIYCIRCKGERHWLKYVMMLDVIIVFAVLNATMSYSFCMLWPLPVVLSARYYSVAFTRKVSVTAAGFYALSTWIGEAMDFCYVDMNAYLVPGNVTITTVEPISIYDALANAGVEPLNRVHYAMTLSYFPYIMEFCLVAMVCVSVARHGRTMVIKQAEITAEAARVESEMSVAAEIQSDALPRAFPAFPTHGELELFATMDTAREIGGDFYDYFSIDDDHIAIVMADVSGKGVPAALLMMIGKTMIENWAQSGMNPSEVFTAVNKQLSRENDSGQFITAWMGILELSTGRMHYVNAGHCPPLLRRKGEQEFRYLRDVHGVMLAFFDDTVYEQGEMEIGPGDELYLYTDGVTEAINAQNGQYGYERLVAYLNEHGHEPLEELLPAVRAEVAAFAGDVPQFDDITMLMLRLKERH